jgi:hypothetical protein
MRYECLLHAVLYTLSFPILVLVLLLIRNINCMVPYIITILLSPVVVW